MNNIHMTPKDIENNDIYHYLYRGWIFISYKKKSVLFSQESGCENEKSDGGANSRSMEGLAAEPTKQNEAARKNPAGRSRRTQHLRGPSIASTVLYMLATFPHRRPPVAIRRWAQHRTPHASAKPSRHKASRVTRPRTLAPG
jgi:hypothetical protein